MTEHRYAPTESASEPKEMRWQVAASILLWVSAVVLVLLFAAFVAPELGGGIGGMLLALGLILVFAFAVSWIWMVVGMKVKTPESVMTTSFLFLFPLTFVSNIFVDPATMPSWLQGVVGAIPSRTWSPPPGASCTAPTSSRMLAGFSSPPD